MVVRFESAPWIYSHAKGSGSFDPADQLALAFALLGQDLRKMRLAEKLMKIRY